MRGVGAQGSRTERCFGFGQLVRVQRTSPGAVQPWDGQWDGFGWLRMEMGWQDGGSLGRVSFSARSKKALELCV